MSEIEKYAKLIYKPKSTKKELEALKFYKGSGYLVLNELLRGLKIKVNYNTFPENFWDSDKTRALSILLEKYYEDIKMNIKLIDRVFAKNRTFERKQVVYRGVMRNEKQISQMSLLESSKSIEERAFMSTTIMPQYAFEFSSGGDFDVNSMFMLELELMPGMPYLPLSWTTSEPNQEMIRGSEFEIFLPRGCILHFVSKKVKSYPFQIRFENILKRKKYKVLTYVCKVEYPGLSEIPDLASFNEQVIFEETLYNFDKILLKKI